MTTIDLSRQHLYHYTDDPITGRGVVNPTPWRLLGSVKLSFWCDDPNATRATLGLPTRSTLLDLGWDTAPGYESMGTWMHRRAALNAQHAQLASRPYGPGRNTVALARWVTVRDLFDPVNVALIEKEGSRPDTWWICRVPVGVQADRSYRREPRPTAVEEPLGLPDPRCPSSSCAGRQDRCGLFSGVCTVASDPDEVVCPIIRGERR